MVKTIRGILAITIKCRVHAVNQVHRARELRAERGPGLQGDEIVGKGCRQPLAKGLKNGETKILSQ